MNFVHYTKQFTKELASDGKKDAIEKKLQDIAKVSNVENLKSIDKYRKGILVLKFQRSNTCRIIIQPETIEIDEKAVKVLFVRHFVEKRGFDYFWGTVIHPQLTSGEWLSQNPLPDEDLEEFILEYKRQEKEKIKERSQLPSRLTDWLDSFKFTLDFQIYERETWVSYSNDRSTSGLSDKAINIFRETLKTIVGETTNSDVQIESINSDTHVYTAVDLRHGVGLIYSKFPGEDKKTIYVLHDGAQINMQRDRWDNSLKKAVEERGRLSSDLRSISRDAFRAYPTWILKEEEQWGAIERHDGSNNLSLLPEQVDFLRSVQFPTYINGQAGSGKSTMLYYLFANTYFYQQGGSLDGNIVFLTENELLLERTQQSIIGLLSSNTEFQVKLGIDKLVEVRNSFQSFRNFLLDFLPEDESIKYDLNKYLDFPRFKKLYSENFNLRRSAEEAWFVLSTYVLGYFEDRNVDTIEKYTNEKEGIPAKFRVIGNDDFREIVNEALPFYNKLIAEGNWDKIQLVRAIRALYGESLPKQYTVVFCDEAQDFSRIELRLIIQSSEYTKYDLSTALRIPIIFAGDALQTVNPTGFSEVRLHQMYYDALKEAGFNYQKEISTYVPEYNYRSVESVVRLANIVQNYRKENLKEASIKQIAKRTGSSVQIPFLHSKQWLSRQEIRQLYELKFKYKSFIVPVDLDEDESFIIEEDLLKFSEDGSRFGDIKSSIDAKGAEYSQVVLFGFGDHYLSEFDEFSWESHDTNFKRKYFFNKLYVGITRAQNELVIIDSDDAIKRFWMPLFQIPDSVNRWEQYSDLNEIILINPKTGLDDVQTSTPDEARDNASRDMEEGILTKNRARLVVARNVFLMLGDSKMAAICDGHQNAVNLKWMEAGNFFAKGGEMELASNAFFQGQCWNEVKEGAKIFSGHSVAARVVVSNLMRSSTWTKEDLHTAYSIRKEIGDVLRQVVWYDEFVSSLLEFSNAVESPESKRELAYILEGIARAVDSDLWMVLGQIYFESKQFSYAIAAWDKVLSNEENPEFNRTYIIASIEKAIDDQNLHDQLLWSGRLLLNEEDPVELRKLGRNILGLWSQLETQLVTFETKSELYRTIYMALVIGNEMDRLPQIGAIVEKTSSSGVLLNELYNWLIFQTTDPKLAIFLKERWARQKWFQLEGDSSDSKNELELLTKLNHEFSSALFPFEESNFPWTIEELRAIPDVPSNVQDKPPLHFQSVRVDGFKSFRDFSISNLGLFNLILGGNNSGKTSLLELFLFDAEADKCLLNLLYVAKLRENSSRLDRLEAFFETIRNRGLEQASIEFTIINGRRFWTFEIRNSRVDEVKIDYSLGDTLQQYLTISNKSGTITRSGNSRERIRDLMDSKKIVSVPFIPFGKGYSDGLSLVYFSNVGSNRALRQDFAVQMKLFIPQIVEINHDPNQDLIMITEEIDGIEQRSPLHEFGEGANKLFRILVQIFVAKDARLMIDEIDAGIHYSIFPKFWSVILQFAKRQNVQLFATTHNEECIRFFEEVLSEAEFEDYRKDARVITLDRHVQTNEIVPIVRDFENLKFSIDNQYEIRGRK